MVYDLSGNLVNGQEIFFIQDAVPKGITKASEQDKDKKVKYIDSILITNLIIEKIKFRYFSALFMPSVTASFLAFSKDSALDFSPSLTP